MFQQDDEMTGTAILANLQKFARERADNEDEEIPDVNLVNEIIAPIDTDAMVKDLPAEGVNLDEEELKELLAQVSEESLQTQQIQSIDDALNFPLRRRTNFLTRLTSWTR